jgi:hypothetical protein
MESSTEERKEVYQILIRRIENIKKYSYIPDTLEQYVKIIANNLEVWQIVWLPLPPNPGKLSATLDNTPSSMKKKS